MGHNSLSSIIFFFVSSSCQYGTLSGEHRSSRMWLFLSISRFLSVNHFIKNSNSDAINLNGTFFVVKRGNPSSILCSKKTHGTEIVHVQVLSFFSIHSSMIFWIISRYAFININ